MHPFNTLPFFDSTHNSERLVLVARWNALTKDILPNLAAQHRWPISNDHCFMRVCLDTAIGQPWHLVVKRPAVRHLTDEQLTAAIIVAESLVRSPDKLQPLNRQSITWRKRVSAAEIKATK